MYRTNLLICVCEDKDCEYEFITNSYDNLHCPNCGSENIKGEWKEAVILENSDDKNVLGGK